MPRATSALNILGQPYSFSALAAKDMRAVILESQLLINSEAEESAEAESSYSWHTKPTASPLWVFFACVVIISVKTSASPNAATSVQTRQPSLWGQDSAFKYRRNRLR